jgi:hypothetical protein
MGVRVIPDAGVGAGPYLARTTRLPRFPQTDGPSETREKTLCDGDSQVNGGPEKGLPTMKRTKFTDDEAVDVWLRHWSGQTGDDIAHDYRINAGRVSDVLNEKTHPGSKRLAQKLSKKMA